MALQLNNKIQINRNTYQNSDGIDDILLKSRRKKIKSQIVPLTVLTKKYHEKGIFDVNFMKEPLHNDMKPVYEEIPIHKLNIDLYQRKISPAVINKMKTLNRKLLVPATVWRRPDGELVVTDGQHKIVRALMSLGDPNFLIPCMVYTHPSDRTLEDCMKEESDHVITLNTITKHYGSLDKYHAGIAVNDKKSLEFDAKLKFLNLRIEGIGSVRSDRVEIDAGHGSVMQAYKINKNRAREAVNIVSNFYKKRKHDACPNTALILGMTKILGVIEGLHHSEDLSTAGKFEAWIYSQLGSIDIDKLLFKTSGNVGSTLIARKIVKQYNDKNPDYLISEDLLELNDLGDPSNI